MHREDEGAGRFHLLVGSLRWVPAAISRVRVFSRCVRRVENAEKPQEDGVGQENPNAYLEDVAETLNELGNVSRDQNRMQEAGKAYEEALTIRRTLAQKSPEAFLPDLAETLNNVGILESAQGRIEEARKQYAEALKIYEAFAEQNSERFSPDVTRVKKLLAELSK